MPEGGADCDVVGLMVEAEEHPGKILLGVRAPTATSRRHPEVLSTPTMRVPSTVLGAALQASGPSGRDALQVGEIRCLYGPAVAFGREMSLIEPAAFLAEGLLARKLGVASALVGGGLHGEVKVVALAYDRVFDPASADGAPEMTRMLTLQMRLESGASSFPVRTDSYSALHWVDAEALPAAVEANEPTCLVPAVDLNVCLQGLCVRSAAAVLVAEERSRHVS